MVLMKGEGRKFLRDDTLNWRYASRGATSLAQPQEAAYQQSWNSRVLCNSEYLKD